SRPTADVAGFTQARLALDALRLGVTQARLALDTLRLGFTQARLALDALRLALHSAASATGRPVEAQHADACRRGACRRWRREESAYSLWDVERHQDRPRVQ